MFPGGGRYEGEFLVGQFHGYGVYQSDSGMKYEVLLDDVTVMSF